jgi:N-methylhydantoinase B/oxoprolinase/acetone carboxylase alpha subunit
MFSPRRRDVQKVLEDYKNGYISLDAARNIYGVEINESTLEARRL